MNFLIGLLTCMIHCVVCGANEDEVVKLFCFPEKKERLRNWQSSMGMVYQGKLSQHVRICNRHFTEDCFIPCTSPLRLRANAVPTIPAINLIKHTELPVVTEPTPQVSASEINILPQIAEPPVDLNLLNPPTLTDEAPYYAQEPQPSTSYQTIVVVVTEPTPQVSASEINILPQIAEPPVDLNLLNPPTLTDEAPYYAQEPQPSTSYQTIEEGEVSGHGVFVKTDVMSQNLTSRKHSSDKSHIRRSLFKDVEGLCSVNITPRKKALMGIVKRKHNQLRKLQNKCKKRGNTISFLENIEKSPEMCNVFKNMSPAAIQLMIGQIRCSKRSPQGRRWTLDQKIIALTLYKRSPKCYTLLRRLLTLPSKFTLHKLLQKVPFSVGINKHIFAHLGECLQTYEENDRLCCLIFDEMAIREHVQYNSMTDCIEGVEDFGNGERTENLAKYGLVFLVQGITRAWKQPVAYYFSRNGISSNKLKVILEDILDNMHKVNIPVCATVCDMGTTNVKALKDLGCTVKNPFFSFQGRKIFSIFDAPHLLKCIRNLLLHHNMLVPTVTVEGSEQLMEARWEDIRKAYEQDKKNPLIFRSLHKLKDHYLDPLRKTAMKVKIAAQTMSRSVSVYLFNLIQQGLLPSRALATATLINDVDQMFDSLNGSNKFPPDGKPFRCAITDDTGHVAFWEECKKKVSKWRFLNKPLDKPTTSNLSRRRKQKKFFKPPSQQGWLHTLQAFKEIWCHVKTLGVKYLKPRQLNQDAVENLFGSIRAGCGCNENPTVTQFVSSLKTQIISGLTNQALQGTNCEDDEQSLLSNLRSFFSVTESEEEENPKSENYIITSSNIVSELSGEIGNIAAAGSVEILSVAYVSGFIVKRLFKSMNCDDCTRDLCSDNLEPFNQFISLKEFSDKDSKLYYPSEKLTVAVGCGITLLENVMNVLRKEINIQAKAVDMLQANLDFSFLSCYEHSEVVKTNVIHSICRIGVPWYCTRLVRDIKSQSRQNILDRKMRKLQHV